MFNFVMLCAPVLLIFIQSFIMMFGWNSIVVPVLHVSPILYLSHMVGLILFLNMLGISYATIISRSVDDLDRKFYSPEEKRVYTFVFAFIFLIMGFGILWIVSKFIA